MTKTELLADIATKCLRVVSTIEEPDATKNAAGVKQYITHVMEQDGQSVRGRNIGWYTMDEGQAGELAFYRDVVTPKRNFRDAVEAYINSITPKPYANLIAGTYIRAEISSVNENEKTAIVMAYKRGVDLNTCVPTQLLVWKNGAQNITHVEIVQ